MLPAIRLVQDLLTDLYPGDDRAVIDVRTEVARVCSIPGPSIVLLQGPPGTGKTSLARTIAMCRRIVAASPPPLLLTVERARQELLSTKPLTWYRDISLAGLVETLADAQLFGIGEKVATGVSPRVGIFEQAMTGHDSSGPVVAHDQLVKAARDKKRWVPLVTGGVVLLDEIGDLAPTLQAKLLRVLNGERQYRLGMEGNNSYAFQYSGMTILATWRDLEQSKEFRRDLWQRIYQNRIRVPSLSMYSVRTREQIVRSVYQQFQQEIIEELERLRELGRQADTELCSTDWLVNLARFGKQPLAPEIAAQLAQMNWGELGEFRGLRNVVRRLLLGSTIQDAIMTSDFSDVENQNSDQDTDLDLLSRFLAAPSLSVGWRQYRSDWARRVNNLLRGHSPIAEDLLHRTGRDRRQVKKELENLLRSETSGSDSQMSADDSG